VVGSLRDASGDKDTRRVLTRRLLAAPLAEPEWVDFVCGWRHLRHEWVTATDSTLSYSVSVGLYRDQRGKRYAPPLTPYSSLILCSPDGVTDKKAHRHWLSLSEELASEFMTLRPKRPLSLPPGVSDVRGWQWAGFRAELRFTSVVSLPWQESVAERTVRARWRKAERAGFRCERTRDSRALLGCLRESEKRQGFDYGLNADTLELALQQLDDKVFRAYICRSSDGGVASARIILCGSGGTSLDWVAGTSTKYLDSGATQLLIRHVLESLGEEGYRSFDYGGANIRNVAAAKMNWGGELVPFAVLLPPDLRAVARAIQSLARFPRGHGLP
jgi:hypothetical protein